MAAQSKEDKKLSGMKEGIHREYGTFVGKD